MHVRVSMNYLGIALVLLLVITIWHINGLMNCRIDWHKLLCDIGSWHTIDLAYSSDRNLLFILVHQKVL